MPPTFDIKPPSSLRDLQESKHLFDPCMTKDARINSQKEVVTLTYVTKDYLRYRNVL